jgi:uncharacterized protein (DUF1330 family)
MQIPNFNPAMAINPSPAQAAAFFALDQSGSAIFVNLHKYLDRAHYPEGYDNPALPTNVTGRDAYHRYLHEVERSFLPKVGGHFLVVSPVDLVIIGSEIWDEVVIGQYPSRQAAIEMTTLPGYAELTVHREAGLESVLTLALGAAALARLK